MRAHRFAEIRQDDQQRDKKRATLLPIPRPRRMRENAVLRSAKENYHRQQQQAKSCLAGDGET